MKQYLISEEELFEWIASSGKHIDIDAFLESKQPVQTLDEDKIREIIKKYTKPNMMEWIHLPDKSKPVSSCFIGKEDYDACVKELSNLISDGKDNICHNPLANERYYDGNGNDVTDKIFVRDITKIGE